MNQLVNYHIENFNFQHMWRILILMPTSEFSKKLSKLMGTLWRLISRTYLVSFYKTIFGNGVETLYNIIPITFLRSWSKCFANVFWIVKNDEEVYMQLRNLRQLGERIEVYYECSLKLVNYLQVKATDVFLTTIFIEELQAYLRLTTIGMVRDTLYQAQGNCNYLWWKWIGHNKL